MSTRTWPLGQTEVFYVDVYDNIDIFDRFGECIETTKDYLVHTEDFPFEGQAIEYALTTLADYAATCEASVSRFTINDDGEMTLDESYNEGYTWYCISFDQATEFAAGRLDVAEALPADGFNGWGNQATFWAAHFVGINGPRDSFIEACPRWRRLDNDGLAETLHAWVASGQRLDGDALFASQMIDVALDSVDWRSIVERWRSVAELSANMAAARAGELS